ncbi:F-box protein SKIP23 [Rosa chinensis]|uniref:F-box protein SKIP23 n=1 Tax=Rosa chinensis TaxID=74649 RepID=UPI001AD9452C|nr:F-box protein SKIP23 [Rosa chinensis]
MDITVDWSNLPVELWPLIGEKLELCIQSLQFRSVCHSWRSCASLPPFTSSEIPSPILRWTHLLPLPKHRLPPTEPLHVITGAAVVWMLVGQGRRVRHNASSESDHLQANQGQPYVVDSLGYVFTIDVSSEVIVKISSKVIGFGGRKHLVESCGELYVVDMYFDQEQNKQEGAGVELDFSLFVRWRHGRHQRYQSGELKVVDFKVCKLELLNGELGRWVEVKSLGDRAFFLAMDCCFSVSAQELAGCRGNCIYFSDENNVNLALREVTRPESFMFYLEDHSIQKLRSSPGDSQIFWPPPIELGSTCSYSLD